MSENLAVAQQELLAITKDFQAVFSTPQGQRVLDYIMGDILKAHLIAGFGVGDRANYILAMHDVANQICAIMDRKFTEDDKPGIALRPSRSFVGRTRSAA